MLNGLKRGLILGKGEVGSSLYKILSGIYKIDILDKNESTSYKYDILHICFPYSENFVKYVKEYIDKYKPKVTVIHSTVPVGTTVSCGKNVFHSPVRGKHPNLVESLKLFTKEIGGRPEELGYKLQTYFRDAGIPARYLEKLSEDTEFAKIMSTTYYGWNIVFCKEMKKLCDKKGIDFNFVYKMWNDDYNKYYRQLGDKQYTRPVLDPIPGPIGGHCVVQNCVLDDNFLTETIIHKNFEYEKEN